MRDLSRSVPAFALALAAVASLSPSCGTPKGSHDDEGPSRFAHLAAVPSSTPEEAKALSAGNRIETVFVIAMENQDWKDIRRSKTAPYINETLLPMAAHAQNYHSPFDIHPSEPNYIWMEAGDNLAISDSDPPADNYRTTKVHLTRQLQDAGVSWKSYQEGILGTECPLTNLGRYAVRHNPSMFFDDITDGRDPQSANCIAHVRPYNELARDLLSGEVARFNFITPDLCHAMHDDYGCESMDQIRNGDRWLAQAVPQILASEKFKNNGALFIVWDENEGEEDEAIGMIVLSPLGKTDYANTIAYTHSSFVRTMQEIFGLRPFLRDAEHATSLGDLFVHYP